LLAGLPAVMLLSSPNRVLLSIVISVGYIVALLVIDRPATRARPVMVYALVVAVFLTLQLLAAETINATSHDQQRYGFEKTAYFLTAVLPLALVVAYLVRGVSDIKAIAWGFAAVGLALAVATLLLRDPGLLGYGRYPWLGNLSAIGALVFVQSWLVRRPWLMALLTMLCVIGALLANSRQSYVALIMGLIGTALFWLAVDLRQRRRQNRSLPRRQWLFPLILGLAVPALTYGWTALPGQATLPRLGLPDPRYCQCVVARLQNFSAQPGGRLDLLRGGVSLFRSHPLVGAGLGSFTNLHLGYQYPHNVALELASETGLIGLLLLLGPIVAAMVRLVLRGVSRASGPIATLLAITLVWTAAASFSGDLASERGFWIFGLLTVRLAWPGAARGGAPAQETEPIR